LIINRSASSSEDAQNAGQGVVDSQAHGADDRTQIFQFWHRLSVSRTAWAKGSLALQVNAAADATCGSWLPLAAPQGSAIC
jgi:hypothetical protein